MVKIGRWSAYEALGGAGDGRGIAYFPGCWDKLEEKKRRREEDAPQPTCASKVTSHELGVGVLRRMMLCVRGGMGRKGTNVGQLNGGPSRTFRASKPRG